MSMARMMISWTIIRSDWNHSVLSHAEDSSSVILQLLHCFSAAWYSPKVFYSSTDPALPSFSWKAWWWLSHGLGVMPAALSTPWNCVWTPRETRSCIAPRRKTHQQRLILNHKNRPAKDLRMSFSLSPCPRKNQLYLPHSKQMVVQPVGKCGCEHAACLPTFWKLSLKSVTIVNTDWNPNIIAAWWIEHQWAAGSSTIFLKTLLL